ncbi:hypothetical protein ACJX0J_019912, partial [Zea mays]
MELIIALNIAYLLLEAINIEYLCCALINREKNSAVELNNKLRQELLLHFCTYHFQIISCVQKEIKASMHAALSGWITVKHKRRRRRR